MTRIAVFQMSAAIDPDHRLARIVDAMQEAAGKGARLLIAPELALSGYGRGPAFNREAQTADGAWVRALGVAAARHGIGVIAGFPEAAGDTRYISAVMIDAAGPDAPVIYRKGCLYGPYEKRHFTAAGPTTVIAEIAGLKVGCLICYDVEFPENVRRLALAGADLVAVPTALPNGAPAEFIARHIIPVRAFENQIFVAYADNADSEGDFTYQGLSSIVAPDGSVLAAAGEGGDALIYADLRPGDYARSRAGNPYLKDAQRQRLIQASTA
ncbi:carbon-nitrogen hydrolase family protein [Roseovarius sp. M141]|uniref:carbon-nitrogen hydrolase family protein n=1 Tax=Roseovarius sp. M141 TaxID=2583806 RepID=UPI0020CD41A9|nr:carbon-nitrogen hydrolase family protein [Roseovarius sp. M141]MCQ0091995.1 carbon-nitrogen hydrolase family protein [Roseovarius sp. M141]